MESSDVFLTPRDVQSRYRITEGTLYRHIKTGEIIPPIKIGGLNRWRLADLVAMERRRNAAAALESQAEGEAKVEDWIEDEVKDDDDDPTPDSERH